MGCGSLSDGMTLKQLARLVDSCPVYRLPQLIETLKLDGRQGAHRLAQRAKRRWHRSFGLWSDYQRRFLYERRLWRDGYEYVAGVDEAGRGPLAGPVVAAAVILRSDAYLPELNDSKLLSPAMRDRLATAIIKYCSIAVGIGFASVSEINRLNIFQATQLAMRRAVRRLQPQPDYLLIDGPPLRDTPHQQLAIVNGDRLSNSIAAASVVAKVSRDRLMVRLDRRFPGYGFAEHKGYATEAHRLAIQKLGPSPLHRVHFKLIG